MGKRAPAAIKGMQAVIDPVIKSAGGWYVLEGDDPQNGYHTSYEDMVNRGRTGAYSIQHKLDRVGGTRQADGAAALDITANRADMIIMTNRIHTAVLSDDPRLIGKLAEFGGTLNGTTVTAMNVAESITEVSRYISFDRTHLTHLHLGVHRSLIDLVEVCDGIAQVVAGIPLDQGELDMKWPECMPYPQGTKLVTVTGINARYGPGLTAEIRTTVAAGYPITVKACAFVDGLWWVRGGSYWYATADATGKAYLKKAGS